MFNPENLWLTHNTFVAHAATLLTNLYISIEWRPLLGKRGIRRSLARWDDADLSDRTVPIMKKLTSGYHITRNNMSDTLTNNISSLSNWSLRWKDKEEVKKLLQTHKYVNLA